MKRAPYRKSANSSDNAASCVGTRGPMHQVERMERKKREEEVRRPWRGSGRGYIVQSGEIVKRHGSSIKAARGGRYPQTGRGYTTRGRRMTVHGRRWRTTDELFNGSRFWRPANRVIKYFPGQGPSLPQAQCPSTFAAAPRQLWLGKDCI